MDCFNTLGISWTNNVYTYLSGSISLSLLERNMYMLNVDQKKAIINALQEIINDPPPPEQVGLCSFLAGMIYRKYHTAFVDDLFEYIRYEVKSWRFYSGSPVFPVPSCYPRLSAERDYCDNVRHHWHGHRLYLRLDLCHYLITALEREL
jgi:hypothetical protein